MQRCDAKCKYFPQEPYRVHKQYKDENGAIHRKADFYCEFDDHIIKSWRLCENYKCRVSK